MRITRVYPKEYMLECVRIYIESKKGYYKVSEELGVPRSTLKGWIDKYMDEIKSEEKSKKGKKKDYESIIKEKEKQIQFLLEENQILKKSIGIFTRNPLQK
jgi:transposase